jgi:hypothetical protein
MVVSIEKTKIIHVDMAIRVYEYGRGGKYAYMFRYTQAGSRERKIHMSRDDTNMEQGYGYINRHRDIGVY